MRGKTPHAYNDAFANAHEARFGRYDKPRKRPYSPATCAARKTHKIYKIFSEQHVNFSKRDGARKRCKKAQNFTPCRNEARLVLVVMRVSVFAAVSIRSALSQIKIHEKPARLAIFVNFELVAHHGVRASSDV